ncbi:MAG: bifunctional riboflavin kinase/FAD synthetase [Actinomycetota bacterium]|nr:bifunctional riboflavin kinase/FAD synthetase [Actinomycetota bacterium]
MEVHTDLATFPALPTGTAVTIGAYDGVHLGHQAILRQLRRLAMLMATGTRGLRSESRASRSAAEARPGTSPVAGGGDPAGDPDPERTRSATVADSIATVLVTFDRHPATVVRPESAPKLLTDLDQKLEVLAATGDVDHVVVIRFDAARSQEEPEDFVKEVLVDGVAARIVVVGEDFHFGRRRRGNVALLRQQGAAHGFDVVGLGLVEVPGVAGPVSSTAIRRLLEAGRVDEASALLGRPHEVRGTVAGGDRRGHDLGFPTANVVVPPDILLPAPGIYAGWYLRPDGVPLATAISLGRRPTFHPDDDSPLVLEAYLLDFEGDLYGEPARVRFVGRLRDEERYDSVADLVAQTTRDVEDTRALLGARR